MDRKQTDGMMLERRRMWDFYEEEEEEMQPLERGQFQYAKTLAGDWEYVRENVYPALMDRKNARIDGLVHTLVLDLAVAYAIRIKLPDGENIIVWIDDIWLKGYGISPEALQEQAIKNLEKDGYRFRQLEEALLEIPGLCIEDGKKSKVKMDIFTNRDGWYGAAGLLAKEAVRQFAGGCDYYILPSSVHELIFLPASDVKDAGELDRTVEEISLMVVSEKDRLSCHSYFYDGLADEVRLCR